MASVQNIASPLPYLTQRETGLLTNLKSHFFNHRLQAARNLYRRDLVCHFGCVNAVEFSSNGEWLVSGGDDRRVMFWEFGKAILDQGKPEPMKALHQSNIFCLGITSDNQRIFSGGNDDIVIVHDTESKAPLEVLTHQRAVCSLSIDPCNERVVSTAGNDGRLLLFDTRQSVHESLVIARARKPFHGVAFHPQQAGVVASANARDGVALWDLRSPKHPIMRYVGSNGTTQNSMSVSFNTAGNYILALRRRQSPVLYATQSPEPVAEFYHQDYYNSCTMKTCAFAGEGDKFVLSGSDDFNLYMWKVPDGGDGPTFDTLVEPPHMVLYGHRSIVNQVRYNPHYCLVASSGVEKIIKIWSAVEYPQMRGELMAEASGSDNPREIYSHEYYVSLVHHSGQIISHNYAEQSTSEDPRMMAFFDSLIQRELECRAEESDSGDGSSSNGRRSRGGDSSDSDRAPIEFLPWQAKRANPSVLRSQRGPNRLARLVASRYHKDRAHKRGLMSRRETAPGGPGGPRRPPAAKARRPRPSAVSSERTDSDEPRSCYYRSGGSMIRPMRRRTNLTRAAKRKSKCTNYRKLSARTIGTSTMRGISDSNIVNFESFEDNLAVPSTSTGYRGESSLFRIAEVDSDDDHSPGGRAESPPAVPEPTSIVPTPINGSRDCIGDALRIEDDRRRRVRRNGRVPMSDSSVSPPPTAGQMSPKMGHTTALARLMNETNESELESSGSAGRPAAADDPDRFRRMKRSKRNYRNHLDSDSN